MRDFCGDVEAGEVMPKFQEALFRPQAFQVYLTRVCLYKTQFPDSVCLIWNHGPRRVHFNGRSCGRFICHFPVHSAHW